MVARLNFRNWKFIHRLVVFFLAIVVATFSIFSFTPPKKTDAEVITAVALGVGCLVGLASCFLASSGVKVTNNGGGESYFEGFMNDAIEDFKAFSPEAQAQLDSMFDSDGSFIGSESDLSFVLNNQSAVGYWQISKGLASILDSFKQWLVSSYNLSASQDVPFLSENSLVDINGQVLELVDWNGSWVDDVTPLIPAPYQPGQSFFYEFANGLMFGCTVDSVANNVSFLINNQGVISSGSVPLWQSTSGLGVYPLYYAGRSVRIGTFLNGGSYQDTIFEVPWSSVRENFQDISIEGSLTDGYDDFQDALDQDLENEQDNADAVIQVGVPDLTDVLSPDAVIPRILDLSVDNALDSTYEGVYENQKEAEDDKDEDKPWTQEVPEGWVVVNGLQSFFPFCIPWDFFSVVSLFNATPEAPYFEWEMDFGGVFDSYTFVFDFSDYEVPAIILRTMLVIVFLIFLIKKTRSWIRG